MVDYRPFYTFTIQKVREIFYRAARPITPTIATTTDAAAAVLGAAAAAWW